MAMQVISLQEQAQDDSKTMGDLQQEVTSHQKFREMLIVSCDWLDAELAETLQLFVDTKNRTEDKLARGLQEIKTLTNENARVELECRVVDAELEQARQGASRVGQEMHDARVVLERELGEIAAALKARDDQIAHLASKVDAETQRADQWYRECRIEEVGAPSSIFALRCKQIVHPELRCAFDPRTFMTSRSCLLRDCSMRRLNPEPCTINSAQR